MTVEDRRTPEEDHKPYDRVRGPAWIGFVYLVWRQMLAFGDLLGSDGRPSSTKLTAAVVTTVMCVIGLLSAFRGSDQPWNWPMFWTQVSIFAVLFGRTQFREYLSVLKGKDASPDLGS